MSPELATASASVGDLIRQNALLTAKLQSARRTFAITTTLWVVLLLILACNGCSLRRQIPEACITYDRATGALVIRSAKDVVLTNVVVKIEGTNVTLEIGGYVARNNTDLILASVKAQQQQLDAMRGGLSDLVKAAAAGASPAP